MDDVIGWFLPANTEASAIWFEPELVNLGDLYGSSTTFRFCPGLRAFTSKLVRIRCPFDIHLIPGQEPGDFSIGSGSSIKFEKLQALLSVYPRDEWRHSDWPLMQLKLPYFFVSDTPGTTLSYLTPDAIAPSGLPGMVLMGEWEIYSWIRPINFVFEWRDRLAEFHLKRSAALLYLQVRIPSNRQIKLTEIDETEHIVKLHRKIFCISSYIRNVFQVSETLLRKRPKRLVRPKSRNE